jgi:hypothetical protein
MKKSRFGNVPCLQDGNEYIVQSSAILDYLAEKSGKFGGKNALPSARASTNGCSGTSTGCAPGLFRSRAYKLGIRKAEPAVVECVQGGRRGGTGCARQRILRTTNGSRSASRRSRISRSMRAFSMPPMAASISRSIPASRRGKRGSKRCRVTASRRMSFRRRRALKSSGRIVRRRALHSCGARSSCLRRISSTSQPKSDRRSGDVRSSNGGLRVIFDLQLNLFRECLRPQLRLLPSIRSRCLR